MKFDIDISLILEAFEMAHGMAWLENLYIEQGAKTICLKKELKISSMISTQRTRK